MAEDFYLDWTCHEPDRIRQMALNWFAQSALLGLNNKIPYRIIYGRGHARRLDAEFVSVTDYRGRPELTARPGPVEEITVAGFVDTAGVDYYGSAAMLSFAFDHTLRGGQPANRLITLAPAADLSDSAMAEWGYRENLGWARPPDPLNWGAAHEIDASSRQWVYWDGCAVGQRGYPLDGIEALLYCASNWFCPSLHRGSDRLADGNTYYPSSREDQQERIADFENFHLANVGLNPRHEALWRRIFDVRGPLLLPSDDETAPEEAAEHVQPSVAPNSR